LRRLQHELASRPQEARRQDGAIVHCAFQRIDGDAEAVTCDLDEAVVGRVLSPSTTAQPVMASRPLMLPRMTS